MFIIVPRTLGSKEETLDTAPGLSTDLPDLNLATSSSFPDELGKGARAQCYHRRHSKNPCLNFVEMFPKEEEEEEEEEEKRCKEGAGPFLCFQAMMQAREPLQPLCDREGSEMACQR